MQLANKVQAIAVAQSPIQDRMMIVSHSRSPDAIELRVTPAHDFAQARSSLGVTIPRRAGA